MINKRIVVTGASGFLGGNFLKFLYRSNTSCFVVPRDQDPSLTALEKADAVVHIAALSSPLKCEENPQLAIESNVNFTLKVASLAERLEAKLIYISTDLVFDGANDAPLEGFAPSDLPLPKSVYARTKAQGEKITLDHGGITVRVSLLCGEEISGRGGFLSWLKSSFIQKKELTLFSDEFRTPVFTSDISEAILKIVSQDTDRILHLGGTERVSRVDFGRLYCEIFNYDSNLIKIASREDISIVPPRPKDVSLNSKSSWQQLGIAPKSLKEGLLLLGA